MPTESSPPRPGSKGERRPNGWSITDDSRRRSCWRSPARCWPSLVELEKIGVCHGDVSTSSLILTDAGDVVLVAARAAGHSAAGRGLRPRRSAARSLRQSGAGTDRGRHAAQRGERHLRLRLRVVALALRSAAAGRRKQFGEASRSCRPARFATCGGTPRTFLPPLAAAISACVEPEPSRRPESMARLAAMLGPPTRSGKEALADCLARAGRPTVRWTTTVRSIRRSNRTPLWMAGAVCCLAAVVAILWPSLARRQSAGDSRQSTGFRVQESGGRNRRAAHPTHRSLHPTSIISHPCTGLSASAERPQSPVVPAAFSSRRSLPPDLVLACRQTIGGSASLDLRAGQCVRGRTGRRAVVLVPRPAWSSTRRTSVSRTSTSFGATHRRRIAAKTGGPAIVQLRAGRAEFRGCSFRCAKGDDASDSLVRLGCSAIRWVHPAQADESETSLPSGRLQLTDCLLDRVGAGLDCRTVGALGIELTNTLHLGAGPLVRLDHCPQPDEPLSLEPVASHSARRRAAVGVPSAARRATTGRNRRVSDRLRVRARPGEPLVRCGGAASPERLLAACVGADKAPWCRRKRADHHLARAGRPSRPWTSRRSRSPGWCEAKWASPARPSSDPAASRLDPLAGPAAIGHPPGIDPAPLPCPAASIDDVANLTTTPGGIGF